MGIYDNKTDEDFKREIEDANDFVRRSRRKQTIVLFSILLLAILTISGFVAYFEYRSYSDHIRLQSGLTTDGTLLLDYVKVIKEKDKKVVGYDVDYYFVVNGQTFWGSTRIYNEPKITKTQVVYVPDDPYINKLADSIDTYKPPRDGLGKALGSVIVVMFWIALIGLVKIFWRKLSKK